MYYKSLFFLQRDHNTVTNCNISFTGGTALNFQNSSNYLTVDGCNFSDFGGAGIWNTDNGTNAIITNNTFIRCDLVSVIKSNDYTNAPIEIFSDNALVQYNSIDSTAYEGIHFRGNNVQVRNNFVNHTSMLRDDGGGIYTGFTGETGKIIDGNIVLNSVGNSRGVGSGDAAANGIYLDGLTDDATVTNNTVSGIKSAGIFLNNARLMKVHGNTVYDAGGADFTKGALMIQCYAGSPYAGYQRSNNVTNNIFFQKRTNQYDVFYWEENSANNSIQNFGVLDSNWYAKATDTTYMMNIRPSGGSYTDLKFWQLQSTYGKEANGHFYNAKLIDTANVVFVYNANKTDSTISLGSANYKDVKGTSYNGSITLQPYTSAILIYESAIMPTQSIKVKGRIKLIQLN
jgi:hypothetical protein